MSAKQAKALLARCGWRPEWLTEQHLPDSIRQFQRGFGFGYLAPDGDPGPITISAMQFSADRDGACTENFAYAEFRSHYGWISLHSALPRGLEVVRKHMGGNSMAIVSGARDSRRNAEVGGAKHSVHLYGGAADIDGPLLEQVLAMRIFTGLGATTNDRRIKHLDVRGVDDSVVNVHGATLDRPSIWGYDPLTGRAVAAPASWSNFPTAGPGLAPLLVWKGSTGTTPPKPAPGLVIDVELATMRTRLDRAERLLGTVTKQLKAVENAR